MRYDVSFSTFRKLNTETVETLDQVEIVLKPTNCDTNFTMVHKVKEADPNDNLPKGASQS